jgi:methylenetetrahydrofolate reductase (NADPH)
MNLATRQTRPFTRRERLLSAIMLFFEDLVKVPLFHCQRCGECILSHTGFVCSQRCPKRLRNGPCGGTGEGGSCEVYPDRKCIWYLAWHRASFLGRVKLLYRVEKIHDWNLEKSSAWLNVFTRRIEPPLWRVPKNTATDEKAGRMGANGPEHEE